MANDGKSYPPKLPAKKQGRRGPSDHDTMFPDVTIVKTGGGSKGQPGGGADRTVSTPGHKGGKRGKVD